MPLYTQALGLVTDIVLVPGGKQHQTSHHVQLYSFQARSFQKATRTHRTQKLGPQNPTDHSTRTESAQGLATSQQLNLRMKLYILNTYIVYLWPPGSLCLSLEDRRNVDAFLATRRGPTG